MTRTDLRRMAWGSALALAFLVVMWVGVAWGQSGTVDCGAGAGAVVTLHEGDLSWVCATDTPVASTATSTSTSTITPVPSNTPVPPTATLQPTSTSTPSKQPTVAPPAGSTPSASTPLCATHKTDAWHGLYDAQNNCRYEHQHGDDPGDPMQCDPLLAEWFGELPTSISYPWQTTMENVIKHDGYIKLCRVLNRPGGTGKLGNDLNWVGRTPMLVAGVYGEFHRHAGRIDREKPVHSYTLWVYACKVTNGVADWSQCGTFKTGGHAHLGIFHCNYKAKYCPRPHDWQLASNHWLPGQDTSGKTVDPYIAVNKDISVTLRSLSGYRLAWSESGIYRLNGEWKIDRLDTNHDVWDLWVTGPGVYNDEPYGWGYNWNAGFGLLSTDDPDSVDTVAYDTVIRAGGTITDAYSVLNVAICQFAPPGFCRFDGSEHAIFAAYVQAPKWWDGSALDLDGVKDGYVTMDTYSDLRGNPKPACTAASATCVHLQLTRFPVGWAGWNAAVTEHPNGKMPGNLREYNPYRLPITHHQN